MTDYPNVRAGNTCPRCGGVKAKDLLLCWPCHHDEKKYNGGSYSAATEARLQLLEHNLGWLPPRHLRDARGLQLHLRQRVEK